MIIRFPTNDSSLKFFMIMTSFGDEPNSSSDSILKGFVSSKTNLGMKEKIISRAGSNAHFIHNIMKTIQTY